MPNMLQTGAAWLGGQLKAHAGRTLSVQQGSTELQNLTATVALHDHEVIDSEGFATSVSSYDWLFVVADLPAGFEFRPGAVVTETLDGRKQKYEAMPLGGGPCFEPADASSVLLMLHTKK